MSHQKKRRRKEPPIKRQHSREAGGSEYITRKEGGQVRGREHRTNGGG